MEIELTPSAMRLFGEIAAGNNRVFYLTDRPVGWSELERIGWVEMDTQYRAVLTDKGRQYLYLLDKVS